MAIRWLAEKTEQTIILNPALADKTVSMHLRGETAETLIHLLSRQLGAEVARIGNAFVIGALRPEDMGILVRRCGRLTPSELEKMVAVAGSGQGRVLALSDGLLVAADKVVALSRLTDALDRVDASTAATWVCQLYLVRSSATDERGMTLGAELDASYQFGRASADQKASGAVTGAFTAWLEARGSNGAVDVAQTPLLLVHDGATARLHSGRNIPVPKRTVSDQGTVTTAEFVNYRDGLDLTVAIREIGAGVGMLAVSLTLAQVDGYNADAPITVESTVNTSAQVASGGVYLLGSLASRTASRDRKGYLSLGNIRKDETGTMEVWARVYRIAGAARVAQETPSVPVAGVSTADFE